MTQKTNFTFRRIPMQKALRIKHPRCPYCCGRLTVQPDAWEKDEHGWFATALYMECDSEPDIDSDDWWEWESWHGRSDYHNEWARLSDLILVALKQRARFYDADE